MPVLVLTARDSWSDKVAGLDAGADDYVAKPFQSEELIARLRALIRRASGNASSELTAGDFVRWTRQVIDLAGQLADAAGPGVVRPGGSHAGVAAPGGRRAPSGVRGCRWRSSACVAAARPHPTGADPPR